MNIQGFTLEDSTKLICAYEEHKGEKTSYFYDGENCYVVSSFLKFEEYYNKDNNTFYGYNLGVLKKSLLTRQERLRL